MQPRDRPTLAIGWDVGGWRGQKQGVAVVRLQPGGSLEWCAPPRATSAHRLLERGLDELLLDCEVGTAAEALAGHRIVVAVDAPLGFPRAFGHLVARAPHSEHFAKHSITDREIDDILAYRECDRFVAAAFGKKPLSAAFDRLGNNATVAQLLIGRWREAYGMRVVPFDDAEVDDDSPRIIEVYPALAKRAPYGKSSRSADAWAAHLPPRRPRLGTDEYDALLCALLGMAFAGAETPGLPRVDGPPGHLLAAARSEGWIYAPMPDATPSSAPRRRPRPR